MNDHKSPLTIEMMLHAYCSAAPWPRKDAPACVEVHSWLRVYELIEDEATTSDWKWDGMMKATEKGRAWVHLICSTPVPIQTWVDPRTKEIID